MKLYRHTGNIKAGLFMLGIILIIGLLAYTQILVDQLRKDNRSIVRLYAGLIANVVQEENDRKLWMFGRGVTHIIILYLCKYFAISVFGPGLCGRPENAIHCGTWDRPSHEDKRSGMPSGHSWTAGCFFAVLYYPQKLA